MDFQVTKNDTEYEASIFGVMKSKTLGVSNIILHNKFLLSSIESIIKVITLWFVSLLNFLKIGSLPKDKTKE